MTPNDIVLKVADSLERANVPFMIVGGFSNNVYGIERNTQDADFVLRLSAEEVGKIAAVLGPDFKLDPQLSFESIVSMTQYYVVRHLHPLFKIELFLAQDDAASQEQFRRRRKVEFHGHTLFFISPEDFVVGKLRWYTSDNRRVKDLEDVRGVLAVQEGKLDLDYIRRWCDVNGTRELFEKTLRSIPPIPNA